jgi:hypothetical protein
VLLEVVSALKSARPLNNPFSRYRVTAIVEVEMKRTSSRFAVLLIALWLPATLASAQWDASTQEGTYTTAPTPPPAPPDQMVSDTPQPLAQEPGKKKAWQPARFTWSINIGVPIILDVPRDVVRPGADIFFFGAADFGFFVIGGDFGLQWNPIDLNNLPGFSGRRPLTRIYLSAPEVRFQVPDLKVVLPYISFAFDMNFWNFAETGVACGYWYCSNVSVYRFTPGFTGKGGVAFEVKESGVYIDVGFKYSFTGKGNFFEQTGWWLEPYIGVLVRGR